jgi:topoisomerase-4 subunit A
LPDPAQQGRLRDLIKEELLALAEEHGDDRRTQIVEREPARAFSEEDLVPSEPVTVVLSERVSPAPPRGMTSIRPP